MGIGVNIHAQDGKLSSDQFRVDHNIPDITFTDTHQPGPFITCSDFHPGKDDISV